MSSSWVCADCARQFDNRNQWHSCGNSELDNVLAGSTDDVVAIYLAVGPRSPITASSACIP